MMKKVLLLLLLCVHLVCSATTYYVATTGNNGNIGDLTHPFATIAYASTLTVAGDVVIVEDGTYTAPSGDLFATLSRSGTSGAYITYKARNIGGAILDGRNNYSLRGFNVSGNYINVEGFEMKGVSERFFVVTGSYINIRDINAHHNAKYCTDTTDGLSFASVPSPATNILFERCIIHDIGRLSPDEGCTLTTTNYYAHDQGIYVSGGSNITIQNCIFYNMHHGFALQIYSGSGAVSSNVKFINNTCVDGNPYHPAGHVIFWGSCNGALIANNIFDGQYQYAIQIYPTGYTYSNVSITKNMTYGGTGITTTGTATGVTVSNNYDNTSPLLENLSLKDYRLTATSPCRDLGMDVGLTTDYIGNARFGLPDIGAYEYSSTAPPVTPIVFKLLKRGKILILNNKVLVR